MNRLFLCICMLGVFCGSSYAQDGKNSYWDEHPSPHHVPKEWEKESAVMVEENTALRYEDNADSQLVMHRTVHRIIKVLDDKGIDDFNTMKVPVYPGQELETLKARTILPNGTVLDVSRDKMKETKDDDNKTDIVFALDGVEKNAEVEWLVTYKKSPVWYGAETIQYGIPVMHASFDLISPESLKFEEKGYQGFPTASDTLISGMRYLSAVETNIPALHEEPYSFYEINRMRAEYKLSYQPLKKEGVRIFTWQELAQKLYSNTYELSDKEDKAVEKYLTSIGVTQGESEEAKIKKIENAIKTTITDYKGDVDEEALRLYNIIASKTATEGGLIRLFAGCFSKAGVKHELGVTTNRNNCQFDTEFENWNNLEKYIFFFPASRSYISPASAFIRYPFTDADVITNKGVFCKVTTIGDVTKAIADIRTIAPMLVSESQNNIIADISFSPAMEATVEAKYTFSGYCSMGVREVVVLLPKDKVKELVKSIVGVAAKPEDILKSDVSGEGFENYSSGKPLVIQATVKASQLTEKAGAKYLLKIGDVIGKQSELYQTSERKQPVDLEFPHSLNRTITVNIPTGYRVQNPEALILKAEYKDGQGNTTAGFTSSYKIESSKLIVNITEFYSQLHIPATDFEPFRKVINTSADFNKVTLLLSKE